MLIWKTLGAEHCKLLSPHTSISSITSALFFGGGGGGGGAGPNSVSPPRQNPDILYIVTDNGNKVTTVMISRDPDLHCELKQ